MPLMKRDQEVIGLLEKFRVANTTQLRELYFKKVSIQYCRRRLMQLVENKHLRRCRSHIDMEYCYYLEKQPAQLDHKLYLLDLWLTCQKLYKIIQFEIEYTCGNLRADGFMIYEKAGVKYGYFIEIHLSNSFDQNKYETLYTSREWEKHFKSFPKVLIVTDKKVSFKPTNLRYYTCGLDFTNLSSIL
jgi:hypothetical protein